MAAEAIFWGPRASQRRALPTRISGKIRASTRKIAKAAAIQTILSTGCRDR
jgi:hypothetical protein